jgi:pectinesterase
VVSSPTRLGTVGSDTWIATQSPALMTAADQLIFEKVRVISHHDSLYPKTSALGTVQRVYFKDSYVEGDEDFIFGRASVVFDHCTIHYSELAPRQR